MNKIIVAIDGFSSCGKSTMAKDLAGKIGYLYVDSGAMYRAVTLYSMQKDWIDEDGKLDGEALKLHMDDINIEFRFNKDIQRSETYLNGENVEQQIRNMEVSGYVSMVSAVAFVRHFVDELLHKISEEKGVVMDGRDIGTVVFPEAELTKEQALAFLHNDVFFTIGNTNRGIIHHAVAYGVKHCANCGEITGAKVGDIPTQHGAKHCQRIFWVFRPLFWRPVGSIGQMNVVLLEQILCPSNGGVDF